MDVKEGGYRGASLAQHTSRDVGLALSKDIGHLYSPLSNTSLFPTLSAAVTVSPPLSGGISRFSWHQGLPDRPGSKRQGPEDPLHRLSTSGCLWTSFHLELSPPWGIKKAPNAKHQIPNKFQCMKFQIIFAFCKNQIGFGHWELIFGIYLGFVI